jgi:hypothetical protein
MDDQALKDLLSSVDRRGRDILRGLMRAEQQRDAFAEQLLRHGNAWASELADVIDSATVNPEMRRRLARILGVNGRRTIFSQLSSLPMSQTAGAVSSMG